MKTATTPPPSAPPQHASSRRDIRVLVVDDEPAILDLVKEMLASRTRHVATAPSAREALSAVLKANGSGAPFDLVITDIRMPGMSGVGLLQNLNAMEPGLPLIAITGYPIADIASQLRSLRCRACLDKPFTKTGLLRAVRQALKTG